MKSRGILVAALVALPAAALAQTPSPVPTGGAQSLSVYVYPEDGGAAQIASHTADVIVRRAITRGWRANGDGRIGDLLDRAPDDLARAADALALARQSYSDALDANARLRLDEAQEDLVRARGELLDAAPAPSYGDLRNVEVYLGVVAFNLGPQDVSDQHFRQAAFLSPGYQLDRNVFPPSVVDAYAQSRAKIGPSPRGSIRVETDVRGALVLLDGAPKGPTPRVLNDVPEGSHYLEVRAPGVVPVLMVVDVSGNVETPEVLTLKTTGAPLRQVWYDARGEQGGSSIARILGVDRVVIGSARSTITGVSPFAIRGATFSAEPRRREASAEASAARDPATTDTRISALAQDLVKAPGSGSQSSASAGMAAIAARRERFMNERETLAVLELGGAYSDHEFDAHGHWVAGDKFSDAADGDPGFTSYWESRTTLRVRYGLSERVTGVIVAPFVDKHLTIGDGSGTHRKASGMADITMGVDVRLPKWESDARPLTWLALRAKLPTGQPGSAGFLREYTDLVLGTGQYDLYAGLGTTLAGEHARLDAEAGYLSHLPDEVVWFGGPPHFLNMGDEERVHVDGALQMGRWLTPSLLLDFSHQHATKKFMDPVSHQFDKARESYLLDAGFQLRASFSEKTEAGLEIQHPAWGKLTGTFMPINVTGPRGYLWIGRRF